MDAQFIANLQSHIYNAKVNAIIPWATVQRFGKWIGGDPNPGTAFNVDDKGQVSVKLGYYFFKQVSRAGQPGMEVGSVLIPDGNVKLIAFASNNTKHPDAFVVTNVGQHAESVKVEIRGNTAKSFLAFQTTNDEKKRYAAIGNFAVQDAVLAFESPATSVTTFFAKSPRF